jgi:DNA-binding CsgD family transcriptional regulator
MTDYLSIIEAAYAESKSPDEWLQGALESVHPHLDRGRGVLARFFHHQPHAFWQGPATAVGISVEQASSLDRVLGQFLQNAPRAETLALMRRLYPCAPAVLWANDSMAQSVGEAEVRAHLASRFEMMNSLGVVAGEPSGHGCIFFRLEEKAERLSSYDLALWRRIAAHLAAGHRLARGPETDPDAVLTPSGKVLHLEAEAARANAEPLTEATRAIDRARGRLRRTDPERALELWQGLVAGRWSLVDHCDHDGRRYVFAKKNAPELRPWHSLTAREAHVVAYAAEGQTLKLIGYQLGISQSSVNHALVRAQRKLGLKSRANLIAAYRATNENAEAEGAR